MKTTLKYTLLSIIPSLILGFGVYYLIRLLYGMDGAVNSPFIWFPIGISSFIFLFVSFNNGQHILSHFLRYAAYECWAYPFCLLIYVIRSMLQARSSLGGLFIGFGGILSVLVYGVIDGIFGLVLYLISKSILKKNNEQVQENKLTRDHDEKIIKNSQCISPENVQKQDQDKKILKILQWGCLILIALIIIFAMVNNVNEKKKIINNVNVSNSSQHRGYVK